PAAYDGPYVINDVAAAARMATEHLIATGSRRIVFFSGEESHSSFSAFREQAAEFERVIRAHGLPFDKHSISHAGLTIDAGRAAMSQIYERVPDLDGLFCANTLCAIGAMETARRLGIAIGSQVGFV